MARYIGPKSKIARKFGEAIFGPDKAFEKRNYPHPRSPEALKIIAQKYGIQVGKELAEAFMLVRLIC